MINVLMGFFIIFPVKYPRVSQTLMHLFSLYLHKMMIIITFLSWWEAQRQMG